MAMFRVYLDYEPSTAGDRFVTHVLYIEAETSPGAAARARRVMRDRFPGEIDESRFAWYMTLPTPGVQREHRPIGSTRLWL